MLAGDIKLVGNAVVESNCKTNHIYSNWSTCKKPSSGSLNSRKYGTHTGKCYIREDVTFNWNVSLRGGLSSFIFGEACVFSSVVLGGWLQHKRGCTSLCLDLKKEVVGSSIHHKRPSTLGSQTCERWGRPILLKLASFESPKCMLAQTKIFPLSSSY